MNLAPYRPKSLDELNQAYDKAKEAERAARPQPPTQPAPQPAPKPAAQPHTPIADAVRARENTQAISGAVDNFIKNFSAKEAAPHSAYAQAKETTAAKSAAVQQEIEKEAQQAFDDVLAFPDLSAHAPEPPAYQRYAHEEAPIKEGDLSGLMDEYIAVMTDQNGEDDNRRSFLRRRKERKKNKLSHHSDSEAAADLFDLAEPAPAAPEVPQPPVVTYEPPVAPVAVPFEEPVAPVEIPFEEPVAPVEIPFEEPVAPVEVPFEEPVAPVEVPVEEPVAPVEIPLEEPVAPVEIPVEEPVVPVEIPVEEPVAPVEVPVEEPVAPVEVPVEEPVAPVEVPFEEPVAPVEVPFEEPAAPVAVPVEEPVAPVAVPVEAPAAPAEAPAAPTVPRMPEYTPYHSPLEEQRKAMDAAPPVRTEKKPKRKINMEPEPVFDPHRLFTDLDEEDVSAAPVTPVAAPQPAPEPAPAQTTESLQPQAPAVEAIADPAVAPAPQSFEDVVSYSSETENDRFTPAAEPQPEPEAAPEAMPDEAPAAPQPDDDEIDYDEFAATELQQEVVIRPSKVKTFFKVIVTLLLIVSLLATACVGLIKTVMNVNTGKSAFGDYYFFAVSNEYTNVGIHSGDLILAKRKLPVELGETVVYVDPDTRSFSFGRNDASSPDPEIYNAWIYNLSGIAVREENLLGVVQTTVPQGGNVVRMVLSNFYTYLGACVGAFFFLLLIRVIFLRKKRRYLTVDELAQQSAAADAPKKGKAKKKKKAKAEKAKPEKKAKKEKKAAKQSSDIPQAPADALQDEDLFSDID